MTTKSQKQERKNAKRYGGRTTKQSGAGWSKKNDVYNDTLLIECKHTSFGQYTLHLGDLTTLDRNASKDKRLPVFIIEFPNGMSYAVIPEPDFYDLVKKEESATTTSSVDPEEGSSGHNSLLRAAFASFGAGTEITPGQAD